MSLDGTLQPVAGVLAIAIAAQAQGMTGLVVPMANVTEAAVVQGLKVYGCHTLAEVAAFLNDPNSRSPAANSLSLHAPPSARSGLDLKDVKGQYQARRALEIAAAGGHNLIFVSHRAVAKQCWHGGYPPSCRP